MFENHLAKLNAREKMILLVAACFILIALLDRLVLGPVFSQMKTMDDSIVSKKESYKRDKRILSFQHRIYEEYKKYNTYLDAADRTSDEIVASLLNKIEGTAKQQSVTVKNIRPGDTEDKILYQVYKTSIDCEGKLKDLLTFMKLLEESDYLFQITQYTMAPKSKGAEIIKASMDIARTLITAENLGDLNPSKVEE